jgi:hypothetical protein
MSYSRGYRHSKTLPEVKQSWMSRISHFFESALRNTCEGITLVHPQRGFAVLFRAYVDDSTEDLRRIFTVGGFVAPDDTWINLEPQRLDFLDTLAPRGVSYFHCTDCFSGAKEFDGIFPAEREEILDRIVSLVITHKLRLIGYGIEEDAYKQYAPKPKRNEFSGDRDGEVQNPIAVEIARRN